MSPAEYRKYFSTLGVFQDDSWETVRTAYKRQIRRWHPDRFQDPDKRHYAENKCKEINLAYQILDQYFSEHGTLPVTEPEVSESPLGPPSPSRQDDSLLSASEPFVNSTPAGPIETRRSGSRSLYRGTFIAVIILAGYFSYTDLQHEDDSNSTNHEHAGWGTSPDGNLANQEILAKTDSRQNPGGQDRTMPAWDTTLAPSTTQNDNAAESPYRLPYVTHGATKRDVLAIQGRPTRETDTEWEYGLSRISFRNGRVTGWYENPMNPLIVER